jgi:transposase InsO family protein
MRRRQQPSKKCDVPIVFDHQYTDTVPFAGCASEWLLRVASSTALTAGDRDERLTGLIKQFWFESGGIYGYRKIHSDLRSRIKKELVLDALLMAVWRRKPTSMVTVNSDQGSQYTSYDWQEFLEVHGLQASMSRRGNCHDNAVA